jgi:hypothetical protein
VVHLYHNNTYSLVRGDGSSGADVGAWEFGTVRGALPTGPDTPSKPAAAAAGKDSRALNGLIIPALQKVRSESIGVTFFSYRIIAYVCKFIAHVRSQLFIYVYRTRTV